MSRWLLLITLLFCSTIMASETYPFDSNVLRHRFQALTQEFRCLVCQNENLAASNAGLARDLKDKIYVMVEAGQSNRKIEKFMLKRYGDFVMFRPPLKKQTLLLWFGPLILLLLGFGIVMMVVRKAS